MATRKLLNLSMVMAAQLAVAAAVAAPAPAASPGVPGAASQSSQAVALPSAPQGDLNSWEKRLLGQPYEQDPVDKRIQRLELLVFGSTQDGSLSERLDALRSAISARSAVRTSKSNAQDSLNLLEQKILKKTFPAEQVDQRLTRLESKLFGKASPSMPAADRIERMKRTLGIGETPPIAENPNSHFFAPQFRSFAMPFGDQSMDANEINRQFSDMFRQLDQQMRSMPTMPTTPFGSPPQFSTPGMSPHFIRPVPRMVPRHADEKLPPYLDPNSI